MNERLMVYNTDKKIHISNELQMPSAHFFLHFKKLLIFYFHMMCSFL